MMIRPAEVVARQPQIDVMIPVAHKDMDMLTPALNLLVKHAITPLRHIYIVWQGPEKKGEPEGSPKVILQGPQQPKIIFIHERTYPFSLQQVKTLLQGIGSGDNHEGWYYQQLLKLYAFRVLPDVLPRLLIHDADVAFMKPIVFLDKEGRSLLSYGYPFRWIIGADTPTAYGATHEITHSHIAHAQRLVPAWQLANVFSGMQHHQITERSILEALLQETEEAHGIPFWEAFVRQIDCSKWNGASEYVLYFHYALNRYPDRIVARHVHGVDIIHDTKQPLQSSPEVIANGVQPDMIGRHGFTSLRSRLKTMDYIPDNLRQWLLQENGSRLAFRLELREGSLLINNWNGI